MAQPILIVGAGLAGLSLARTLSAYKVPVRIFEASPEVRKYSYGITLFSCALEPLISRLKLGSLHEFQAATATDSQVGGLGVVSFQVKDVFTGATLQSHQLDQHANLQSYRCSRSRLAELLAHGLDIELGCKLHKVKQKDSGVQLHFENGKTAEGSLIVAADGIHSVVRKAMLPGLTPIVTPAMAINGSMSLTRSQFLAGIGKYMSGSQTMLGVADRTALHLAVSNHTHSNVLVSWTFTWQPKADDHYITNRKSIDDARQIPQSFFDRLAELGPLAEPFNFVLNPEAAQQSAKYNWLMRSIEIPQSELSKSAAGGIALIGDAAHAMPIVAGQGGNHALLDGVQLGEILASSQPKSSERKIRQFYESQSERWMGGVLSSHKRFADLHKPMQQWHSLSGT